MLLHRHPNRFKLDFMKKVIVFFLNVVLNVRGDKKHLVMWALFLEILSKWSKTEPNYHLKIMDGKI